MYHPLKWIKKPLLTEPQLKGKHMLGTVSDYQSGRHRSHPQRTTNLVEKMGLTHAVISCHNTVYNLPPAAGLEDTSQQLNLSKPRVNENGASQCMRGHTLTGLVCSPGSPPQPQASYAHPAPTFTQNTGHNPQEDILYSVLLWLALVIVLYQNPPNWSCLN